MNRHDEPQTVTLGSTLNSVKMAFSFLWKGSASQTILSVVLSLLSGILPLTIILLTRKLINVITLTMASPELPGLHLRAMEVLLITAGVFVLNVLIQNLESYIRELLAEKTGEHITRLMHEKAVALPLFMLEEPGIQDLLHRARQQTGFRPLLVTGNLLVLTRGLLTLLLVMFILFTLGWFIPIILGLVFIPAFIGRLHAAGEQYRLTKSMTGSLRKAQYFSRVVTTERYARELRLFGLGGLLMDRYREAREGYLSDRKKILRNKFLMETGAVILAILVLFGLYAWIVLKAMHGFFGVGELVLFFLLMQRSMVAYRESVSAISGLIENSLFLSDIIRFTSMPTEEKSKNRKPSHKSPDSGWLIECKDLQFTYPGEKRQALSGISFDLKQGEMICIAGANGSGKSTLIKLLCSLYQPDSGLLMVQPERIDGSETEPNISALFQDFTIFNLEASENIRFGNIQKSNQPEEIISAAHSTFMDDVLNRLPNGMHTILGKIFEEGHELSIGEYQRLALARVFFSKAGIVLLDEPTSSMDQSTERMVLQNLLFMKRRAGLMVASHREPLLEAADVVLFLENGVLVARGKHQELLQKEIRYKNLFYH